MSPTLEDGVSCTFTLVGLPCGAPHHDGGVGLSPNSPTRVETGAARAVRPTTAMIPVHAIECTTRSPTAEAVYAREVGARKPVWFSVAPLRPPHPKVPANEESALPKKNTRPTPFPQGRGVGSDAIDVEFPALLAPAVRFDPRVEARCFVTQSANDGC